MARRRLELELVGDDKHLNRTLGRAEGRLATFGRRADKSVAGFGMLSGRAAIGGFAGGLVASAAIGEARKMVEIASNLQEQTSKTRLVFGQASAGVEAFAKDSAQNLGLARDQTLELASTFGALLRPIGLVGTESANLSQDLLTRGADLASFYNTDVNDALQAIRSGILGESEPLRAYAVQLSEARVQALALADSGKTVASELTAQDKVLARIKILMSDSDIAAGNFKQTQGGLANQSKTLSAELRTLEGDLGTLLLPAVTELVSGLNDGIEAARNLGAALVALGDIKIPPIEVPIVGVQIPGTDTTVGRAFGGLAGAVWNASKESAKAAAFVGAPPLAAWHGISKVTGLPGPWDFLVPPKPVGNTTTAAAAWQRQFGFKPPMVTLPHKVRPTPFSKSGVQPGFKPLPPPPLVTGLPPRLESLLIDARRSPGFGDNLKVLAKQRRVLEEALKDPRLTDEQVLALKRELDGVIGEVAGIYAEIAGQAKDAKDAAADAKRKRQAQATKQRKAVEDAIEANKAFQKELVQGAEDLRDAAIAAIDRKLERRRTGREIEEARELLDQALTIGSPTAVKEARERLGDAKLEQQRYLLQQAEITPTRVGSPGGTGWSQGYTIHIGSLTLPGVTDPHEFLRAMQRYYGGQSASRRGRYGGNRSGI